MSLRLVIPWRVALRQSSPPLHQPREMMLQIDPMFNQVVKESMIVPCVLLKNRLWGEYERDFFWKTTGNQAAALKRATNEMKPATDAATSRNGKPQVRLKQAGGWFAADESFARALEMLSGWSVQIGRLALLARRTAEWAG